MEFIQSFNHLSSAPASMIRRCTENDLPAIGAIINEAAEAYRGVIPADCWHEPYMANDELTAEVGAGVTFWGWQEADRLAAVMGLQEVADVTLIRHAYVRPAFQRRGIGEALLTTLAARTPGPLLVGTWAAADWAIRFYSRRGFRLVPEAEKDRLLQTYWTVPARQRECSVVLVREVLCREPASAPADRGGLRLDQGEDRPGQDPGSHET